MNSGYRQAALKLHGMGEHDRNWLLQQLGAEERAHLTTLLGELRVLGIKPEHYGADAQDMRTARDVLLEKTVDRDALVSALDTLGGADSTEMTAILGQEPDHVAGALLSAYPWPWRADFLAGCGVERRQRFSRVLRQDEQIKSRALAAMILALAQRLAAARLQGARLTQSLPVLERFPAKREPKSMIERMRQWLS